MRFVYFECNQGKKRRFYRLIVQEGLFGPTLTREWGRIGSNGQVRTHPCTTWAELDALWKDLFATRLRRGYRLVASGGHEPPITLFPRAEFDPEAPKHPDVQASIAL